MALTGTIQANLVANLTKFSGPLKKGANDVQTLEKRLKSLQGAAKFGFGILAGTSIQRFVKGTLKEALETGSELNKSLGSRGVKAAEQLSKSFDKFRLSLQKASIEGLTPMLPLLEKAAKFAQTIAQALPGGPVGELAAQNALGGVNVNNGVQQAIDELTRRREALRQERTGIVPGALQRQLLTPNQKQLLDAKIVQLGIEIESLTASFQPITAALEAAKVPGFDVIGLFQKLGFTRNAAGAVGDFATGGISPLTDLAARIGGGAAGLLGAGSAKQFDLAGRIAERAQQLSEQEPLRPGAFSRGAEDTLDRIAQITAADKGAKGFIDIAEEQLELEKKQHEELILAIVQRLPLAIRERQPVPARF